MFWQWGPELYQARKRDSRATMTARCGSIEFRSGRNCRSD
jgi:hypothetical protein